MQRRPAGGAGYLDFGLPGYALFCRRAGSLALTSTCNGWPSERRLRKVLIAALLTSASTNMAYGMNAVQKIVRNIIFLPVVCGWRKMSARKSGRCLDSRAYAMGAIPRDARDVRPRDADIGQFTIAELMEFPQALVVAPPGADEVHDCN